MTRDQIVAAVKANPLKGPRELARELRTTPGTIAGLQYRLRYPAPPRRKWAWGERMTTYPISIQFKVDPDMAEALRAYRERTNQTKSEAIRDLLAWALEEFPDGV